MMTYRILVLVLSFTLLHTPAYAGTGGDASFSDASFSRWVAAFRQEAIGKGISPDIFDRAFTGVAPDAEIIRLDRKQPESTMTFAEYMKRIVSDERKQAARERYQENLVLLDRISKKYGVQPEFIIALWGIESRFGERMGDYNLFEALATLAYDGRRGEFFRKELMNALKIANQGHIEPEEMQGSWAGAMGQCQFMPSSYLAYAADYDGDGRADIWNNQADVFASVANYLSSVGWNSAIGWGGAVNVPAALAKQIPSQKLTLNHWLNKGVTPHQPIVGIMDNTPLTLVSVNNDKTGEQPQFFLVTENFDNILKWNRSRFFATAVGTLADSIKKAE